MKWTITIDKRIVEDIKKFCELNNIKTNDYVCEIIERQFNLDRYGDLNDKIKKPILKPIEGEIVKPIEIVKPKVVEEEVKPTATVVKEKENNVEPTIKKRTRTLKSK